MNWQPAEQTATNPQTGERIALVGGKWVPFTQSATNPETGARVVLIADAGEPPAVVQAGTALREVPRQVGLTARYGVEGPAQVADVITEPIRMGYNATIGRLTGRPITQSTSQFASAALDAVGLPSPATPTERVAGDATRMIAGGAAFPIVGQFLSRGAQGVTQAVGTQLATNPAAQLASAGTAGAAGGAVREAGGSPMEQAVASLAGGLAGPSIVNAGKAVATRARDVAAPSRMQVALGEPVGEQQIVAALRSAGVNWNELGAAARESLRQDIARAMRLDPTMNPEAIARLAAMRNIPGFVPTRGMVSQDPVQITRERNLAKALANSGDTGLQTLPRIENENAAALNQSLARMGAGNAGPEFQSGTEAVETVRNLIRQREAGVDALWNAARNTAGRDVLLDGRRFGKEVVDRLRREQVFAFLPEDTRRIVQSLADGTEAFTVDAQQQFIKILNQRIRSTSDGNMRMAYGIVRNALENVDIAAPARGAAAGPALPNPVARLQGPAGSVPPPLGQEAMDAFARARAATREWRGAVERTPALKAVEEGIEPDQFVRQFLFARTDKASVRGLNELLQLTDGTGLRDTLRNATLRQLAEVARPDATMRFNAASYNGALRNLGDAKLRLLFDERELRQLKDIGTAATAATAQPAGSAVNNSNTAGALIGRLADLSAAVVGKLPLGLNTTIGGLLMTPVARSALDPTRALVPQTTLNQRLVPGGLAALLATQGGNDREDRQRP